MTVSIIIPNYNGAEILKKNLPTVFRIVDTEENKPENIIVVDDCSTDDSVVTLHRLQKYHPFEVIARDKNGGFSSAVNAGVAHSNEDLVILLNTDAVPEKGFIDNVVDHSKNKNMFAVGFMDESIEGSRTVKRGRGIGYWKDGLVQHKRGEVNKTDTFWVSGGSSIFRKSMWDKLGGMNEMYNPFYWEDIDLSYRAQKRGYTITFEPKSVVTHIHSQGSIQSNYDSDTVSLIAFRNQLLFVWANITSKKLFNAYLTSLPKRILGPLIKLEFMYIKGFIKALGQLSNAQSARKEMRRTEKVSDEELLNL